MSRDEARATRHLSGLVRALGSVFCLGCPQLSEDGFDIIRQGAGGAVVTAGAGPAGNGGSTSYGGRGSGSDDPDTGVAATQATLGGCAVVRFERPELAFDQESWSANVWGPALSPDGLTLYFSVKPPSTPGDLYRVRRANRSSAFADPEPLAALNTTRDEGTPHMSADGLALYFFSDRTGGEGGPDIWYAPTLVFDNGFSAAQLMLVVNGGTPDFRPWLSEDGLTMMFGSMRGGGAGRSDLWRADRQTRTGTLSAPENLSELNTDFDEEGLSMATDGLGVLFTSDRSGGAGDLDIWFASRASRSDAFSAALNVVELNTVAADADVHLSFDGTELYFSSNRSGAQRIWRAKLSCP